MLIRFFITELQLIVLCFYCHVFLILFLFDLVTHVYLKLHIHSQEPEPEFKPGQKSKVTC